MRMRAAYAKLAAGTILAAMAISCAPAVAKKAEGLAPSWAKRPNIVAIVADDLGYSDLSSFGSEISTPNLDSLMARGITLTNFHTSPMCSPTRAMFLTGLDNHLAGVGTMAELLLPEQKGIPGYEGALSNKVATIPGILKDHGYNTLISGKWHLGTGESQSPKARGFKRSFVLETAAADHFDQGGVIYTSPKASYRQDGILVDLPKDFKYSTDYYTSWMIKNIDAAGQDRPFFAYLAYTAPHWPLQAPENYLARFRGVYDKGYEAIAAERLKRMKARGLVAADVKINPGPQQVWPKWEDLSPTERADEARRMEIYAAMVSALDENVGRFIRHLKEKGQYDNTVFVFFSDNGTEGSVADDISEEERAWIRSTFDNSLSNLGRPGSFAGYGPNWARVGSSPFRMFKGFTYEGGIRTPAFITAPGWRNGQVSNAYVNVKDLAPTLLAIAGAKHPAEMGVAVPGMQGSSLVPFLEGRTAVVHSAQETDCLELFGRVAVRRGQWKLTYSNPPWGTGRWEIFDIENDPTELADLSSQHPKVLRTMLREWRTCQSKNHINWSPSLAAKYSYGNRSSYFEGRFNQRN